MGNKYELSKPKKPWPSYEVFVSQMAKVSKTKTGKIPCIECRGSGKVRDPDAYNDPIEGYKMAGSVTCQLCRGTGIGKELQYKMHYHEQMQDWRKRMRTWQDHTRLYKSGKRKLKKALKDSDITKAEAQALGITSLY